VAIELEKILQHLTGHDGGRPRRLVWADFRPVSTPKSGTGQAHLAPRFDVRRSYAGRADPDGKHRLSDVQVIVTLNMNESWRVMGCETATLLRHQQGRYDITFVAARELCRRLLELELTPQSDAPPEVTSPDGIATQLLSMAVRLTGAARKDCRRWLDLYDREIRRKLDWGAQARWDDMIADAIALGKPLRNPRERS